MPADSYTEWRTTKAESLLDCQGAAESLLTQVPHAEVGQVNLWSVSRAELGTVVVWPSVGHLGVIQDIQDHHPCTVSAFVALLLRQLLQSARTSCRIHALRMH